MKPAEAVDFKKCIDTVRAIIISMNNKGTMASRLRQAARLDHGQSVSLLQTYLCKFFLGTVLNTLFSLHLSSVTVQKGK